MSEKQFTELEKLNYELEKLQFLIDLSIKSKNFNQTEQYRKKEIELKTRISELESTTKF
jgi:hypothetical protein